MTRPWFEVAFGPHYPLLYAHRDESEAARCLELLPKLAPLTPEGSGLPVLDLGCGDGRHLPLVSDRASVLGIDLSAALLARARERLAGNPAGILGVVRGDMRRIPVQSAGCGGVLSLFTAFGYFGKLEANKVVIKEVVRVLVPGGHWFLDYLDCDAVTRELAGSEGGLARRRTLGPCNFHEIRRLAEEGGRVVKDVTVTASPGREAEAEALGVGRDGLRYREEVVLFRLEDLDALAAAEGLHRTAGAGSYGGAALGEGDRWILVFRKDGEGVAP